MPEDCREFMDGMRDLTEVTRKVLMQPHIHEYFKTKNYKKLLKIMEALYSIASGHVQSRIKEIEEASQDASEGEGEDDFLSHMIYSGTMSVDEIAVNAIDLLGAGINTVSVQTY